MLQKDGVKIRSRSHGFDKQASRIAASGILLLHLRFSLLVESAQLRCFHFVQHEIHQNGGRTSFANKQGGGWREGSRCDE